MRSSSCFIATAVTLSLSSASWQGVWCNFSNFLIRTNTPCPALNFMYLTLPLSHPLSLPPSPDSGSVALYSVTQIETKLTKLETLVDFVVSLFPSRRTVVELTKPVGFVEPLETVGTIEPSKLLTLSGNATVPFVTESNPIPFFTTNSKHYSFSEFESCQRNDSDSFSFDSAGHPTCSLKVMRCLDVCLSYRSVFKLRTRFSTTSCYASICTRKLEEELFKELFECQNGALADVGGTLDCKRSEMENSKQPEKNLEIDSALIVQNKSVKWSYTKSSCGIVERSCKSPRKLELSSDNDLEKGVAIEAWFKFLVDSILCNQGSTISPSKSVTEFKSLQEDHHTYWEQLTSLQKEQAITMIESYFNKPQSLDLGSTIYRTSVPTFVAAFAVVAVFTATIVIVARCALKTPIDDTVMDKPSSKHETIYQQLEAAETEESEVVTDKLEVVTDKLEVVIDKWEVVTTNEEQKVEVLARKIHEKLSEDLRKDFREFKKEILDEFLYVKSEKPKELSNEQPIEESEEKLRLEREAEKRKKRNSKKRDKKREKKMLFNEKQHAAPCEEPEEASKEKPKEASNEKPKEKSNEVPIEAWNEEQKIASNDKPQDASIEEPKEASDEKPEETSNEEPKEQSPEELKAKREAEKRHKKTQKKNRKTREKKKQLKLQAKKEAKEASNPEPQNSSSQSQGTSSQEPQEAPREDPHDASSPPDQNASNQETQDPSKVEASTESSKEASDNE